MTTTHRQRQAVKRDAGHAVAHQTDRQKVATLQAQLDRLREKYEDCNDSRLYWRNRCKVLGAPELLEARP